MELVGAVTGSPTGTRRPGDQPTRLQRVLVEGEPDHVGERGTGDHEHGRDRIERPHPAHRAGCFVPSGTWSTHAPHESPDDTRYPTRIDRARESSVDGVVGEDHADRVQAGGPVRNVQGLRATGVAARDVRHGDRSRPVGARRHVHVDAALERLLGEVRQGGERADGRRRRVVMDVDADRRVADEIGEGIDGVATVGADQQVVALIAVEVGDRRPRTTPASAWR